MGASLLALANEIYMLLKDANILPLQFSYYESIAKLMLESCGGVWIFSGTTTLLLFTVL